MQHSVKKSVVFYRTGGGGGQIPDGGSLRAGQKSTRQSASVLAITSNLHDEVKSNAIRLTRYKQQAARLHQSRIVDYLSLHIIFAIGIALSPTTQNVCTYYLLLIRQHHSPSKKNLK